MTRLEKNLKVKHHSSAKPTPKLIRITPSRSEIDTSEKISPQTQDVWTDEEGIEVANEAIEIDESSNNKGKQNSRF